MYLSDFDYYLPPELIAKEPIRPRDGSRMMVVNSRTGEITHSYFVHLPEFLNPSDVLVLNNTRVLRSRLYGKLQRASGERNIEVLFANAVSEQVWEVLCKPGRRIHSGDQVIFNGGVHGIFGESTTFGLRLLEIPSQSIASLFEDLGHLPLPPYIDRQVSESDLIEYQTVYAHVPGAIAAPTAGLHFTERAFRSLEQRGVQIEKITLHVGIGTFIPVRSSDPREHVLKPESFEVSPEVASRLNAAHQSGKRIVAVGTTTTRTLEYVASNGLINAGRGEADLFILPGHDFRAVDAMLTNFHLPRSTLLMLVSAFATREIILEAYRVAVENKYRFYSYGDCMLLMP